MADASQVEQLGRGFVADTVHRRINELRLGANRHGPNQIRGGQDVFVKRVLARAVEVSRFWNLIEGLRSCNLGNLGSNLFINRRNDLRTTVFATQIDLVAVVARRVVRCRHHDASRGLPMLGCEGQNRSWNPANQPGVNAGRSKNLSAIFGKDITVFATIEPDNHAEPAVAI